MTIPALATRVLGAFLFVLVLATSANAQELDQSVVDAARRLDDDVRSDESVFFEVELSNDIVYVQAELVVTRRILYANNVQLFNDLPKSPAIENALVVSHGNPRQLTYFRRGVEYKALEHKFSVFADASGVLTIPSIEISANVRLDDRRRPRMVRLESPARSVTIKPIPDSYPANSPWLAAEALTLEDDWAPDAQAYEVGSSITRRLAIEAVGVVGSSIAPLFVQTPSNLKRYDDPIELTEHVEEGIVRGSRIEQLSLVPVRPGAIVTPSVEVVWWNTRTDRLATSVVPVRRFNITGAVAAAPSEPVSVFEEPGVVEQTNGWLWPTLAAIGWGLFGVALTLLWLFWRRERPALTEDKEDGPSVAKLARKLPPDPRDARAMILTAMAHHLDVSEVEALRRLGALRSGQRLLSSLERSLYAREPSDFDRNEAQALLLESLDHLDAEMGEVALPPLYATR